LVSQRRRETLGNTDAIRLRREIAAEMSKAEINCPAPRRETSITTR
jgi:hypothetical protein